MNLFNVGAVLAMGAAPSAPGTQPDPKAQFLSTAGFLVIMLVMFYFVLIRPQSRKQKQHTEMLKSLKPGDKIVTSGGMVATVVTVKERTVSVRSADSKFEITRAAVAEVTERSGEANES